MAAASRLSSRTSSTASSSVRTFSSSINDQAAYVSSGARSHRTIRICGSGRGTSPCSRRAARRVCLSARSNSTAADSDIPAKNCGAPAWPKPRGACTQLNQAEAPANSQTSIREPSAASPWLASRTARTEQNIAAPSRPNGTRYSQPPERSRFWIPKPTRPWKESAAATAAQQNSRVYEAPPYRDSLRRRRSSLRSQESGPPVWPVALVRAKATNTAVTTTATTPVMAQPSGMSDSFMA